MIENTDQLFNVISDLMTDNIDSQKTQVYSEMDSSSKMKISVARESNEDETKTSIIIKIAYRDININNED
jgi:hypothetical protein